MIWFGELAILGRNNPPNQNVHKYAVHSFLLISYLDAGSRNAVFPDQILKKKQLFLIMIKQSTRIGALFDHNDDSLTINVVHGYRVDNWSISEIFQTLSIYAETMFFTTKVHYTQMYNSL